MQTYWRHYYGKTPDVDVEEMKKSDSKSKYLHGTCARLTMPLTLDSTDSLETIENEDQTGSEYETEPENEGPDTKKRKTHE